MSAMDLDNVDSSFNSPPGTLAISFDNLLNFRDTQLSWRVEATVLNQALSIPGILIHGTHNIFWPATGLFRRSHRWPFHLSRDPGWHRTGLPTGVA